MTAGEALDAADDLLALMRLPVAKALDPFGKRDFAALVAKLSRAIARIAKGPDDAAVESATSALDRNWAALSGVQQDRAIEGVRKILSTSAREALPAIDVLFGRESRALVRASRRSVVEREDLPVSVRTNATDDRTVAFIRKSQTLFVRDGQGVRIDKFSAKAREVVADGVARGLGREEITDALVTRLAKVGLSRSPGYLQMISSTFTSRARTYTHVTTLDEAGVEWFRFVAVLDEATSDVCRMMNGRRFPVQTAAAKLRDVMALEDPEAIKDAQPWVSTTKDPDGGQSLTYRRGEERVQVARIEESAVGRRDEVGRYSGAMSDADLAASGILMPPLHGHCRSVVIADFS